MKKWLMRLLCSPLILVWYVLGWRPVGSLPDADKFVIIGAPHTSNWDYILFLVLACHFGVRPTVLVKHTLMRGPLGAFIRLMGGMPVDRRSSHHVVEQVVEMFGRRDRMILLLAPEGTRGRTEYWKQGFYHIAVGAHVPILLAFLDYAHKRGGFGPLLTPSGNIEADMATIRAFYETHASGLYPDKVGPVRIQSEAQAG